MGAAAHHTCRPLTTSSRASPKAATVTTAISSTGAERRRRSAGGGVHEGDTKNDRPARAREDLKSAKRSRLASVAMTRRARWALSASLVGLADGLLAPRYAR